MQVLSILIGKPQPTPAKAGMTGYFKQLVNAVEIDQRGLAGDHILDLENHGGPDQAVYVFGEDDRLWWSDTLGSEVPPGFFGENLLISDLVTAPMAIGDQLTIGSVTLEITSPRIPCATYAAHVGTGYAIKQFYAAQRPGAYGRVLQTGQIAIGDTVSLRPYDGDRITMQDLMAHYLRKSNDDTFLERLRSVPAHAKMQALVHERLGKG